MAGSDMIVVTNGEHTIEVTEKAYATFYGDIGYAPVGESGEGTLSFNDKKKAIKAAGIELPAHANKEAVDALYATLPAPAGESGEGTGTGEE